MDEKIEASGVEIKGLQKTSLIDYPGKICAVIFLPNCNFRCPFCQNPDLINRPDGLPTITEKEFLGLLEKRKKWIDAVCITGGEPTLQSGLVGFAKKIKGLGFCVKIDTNGTNPALLKQLFDEKAVDYIAMDIKAPLGRYAEVARAGVDLKKIEESVSLIKSSGLDYEFRTTVMPKLLKKGDIEEIGKWLAGSRRYAMQNFSPGRTLDPSFEKEKPYSAGELESFKKLVEQYFIEVEVRGA